MTRDQTTAAVREHFDAFNDGSLERLMAGFAEDALWVTGRTIVRGREELRGFFEAAMNDLRPHLAVENIVADGPRAACQMTETLEAGQQQHSYSIAAFFTFRDGLIVSAKVYREGSAELA